MIIHNIIEIDIDLCVSDFLQILLAKPEPSNVRDKSAVAAVFKDGSIVRHVPINVAPILYQFLRREVNKTFVEVKCEEVNRGGGYMDWKYRVFIVYTVGHGIYKD